MSHFISSHLISFHLISSHLTLISSNLTPRTIAILNSPTQQLGMPEIDDNGMEIPDRIQDITNNVYPTKDKDSNPLEMEYGLSKYKDHQVRCDQSVNIGICLTIYSLSRIEN